MNHWLWADVPGFLSGAQPTILYNAFKKFNKPENILVEIGSAQGKSSIIIAQSCPLATLYCIDIWEDEEDYQNFKDNTRSFTNIKHIRGESPLCVADWNTNIDAVFLDASHENPNDWENCEFWLKWLKPNGMFMGHDFHPKFPDVIENVQRLSNCFGSAPKLWSKGSLYAFNI